MLLVVDGYNVIKNILGVSRVTQERRDQFIKELADYTKHRGHSLVIVFDGGSYGYPWQERFYGITLMYSGYRESADEVIKEYLSRHKGKNPVLVSSDRELRDYAASFGQSSISVQEFISRINEHLTATPSRPQVYKAQGQAYKTSEESDPDLDALMTHASRITVIKQHDSECIVPMRSGEQKKMSKRERLQAQLRKKI